MSLIMRSGSDPSMVTVFQWRLLRWYPGRTAGWASRSCSASNGSHFKLTRSGLSSRRETAKILPDTLNTDVWGPNGNVSADPGRARQRSRSLAGRIRVAWSADVAVGTVVVSTLWMVHLGRDSPVTG